MAINTVNGQTGDVVLTTADIADSTDKRYATDAQRIVMGNTSGANTGDETKSSIETKLGFSVSGLAKISVVTDPALPSAPALGDLRIRVL